MNTTVYVERTTESEVSMCLEVAKEAATIPISSLEDISLGGNQMLVHKYNAMEACYDQSVKGQLTSVELPIMTVSTKRQ